MRLNCPLPANTLAFSEFKNVYLEVLNGQRFDTAGTSSWSCLLACVFPFMRVLMHV